MPKPLNQVLPPANWYADPLGGHEVRYWDGSAWTELVATGGVEGTDPLPSSGRGPAASGPTAPGSAAPDPPHGQDPAPIHESLLARLHHRVERHHAQAEAPIPVVLKHDEHLFYVLEGAQLIEPKRPPGHWVGGYSGFSFRIAKGVRYHVGGTRGHYQQGEERPAPIDMGTVTITDKRVVFQGTRQVREWAFSRLIGYQNDPKIPMTNLEVSNRQKVSGFLYDHEHAESVHFRLALAVAHHTGSVDDLVASLERELAEHEAAKPVQPAD